MPYIITRKSHRTGVQMYRAMAGSDEWTPDINESAVFRSEKNAAKLLSQHLGTWRRYAKEWVGHQNHVGAVNNLEDWQRAYVAKVNFVLSLTTPSNPC